MERWDYKLRALTKRYHKRNHKFGIEVPKSWDDCVRLDKKNDNTLWQDAARKEMKNVIIAFKIINGEESVPQTYEEIRCHMIFDIKWSISAAWRGLLQVGIQLTLHMQ
jgi:hypothetical protein